ASLGGGGGVVAEKRKTGMVMPEQRTRVEEKRQWQRQTEPMATFAREGRVLAPGAMTTPLVVQRVRRSCHLCQAEFAPPPHQGECAACGHVRCARCPRVMPARREKWVTGYPGDAQAESSDEEKEEERRGEREREVTMPRVQRVYKKPRQRVRWSCEQCQALFVEGEAVCARCGHAKCDTCTRKP
ncbi:hypothetical protein LTS18_004503, partial [Coniosporium uncinatum]